MPNTVTKRVLSSTEKRYTFFLTVQSDGSEESDLVLADISGLEGAPTKCALRRLEYAGKVNAAATIAGEWDHNTDDLAFFFKGSSDKTDWCFSHGNGVIDPASAGGTGDLLLTTTGLDANDWFSLYVELELFGA